MGTVLVLLALGTLITAAVLAIRFFEPHVVADRLRDTFSPGEPLLSRTNELVGACGKVVKVVTPLNGQVDIDGELWEARTDLPENIQKSEAIRVERVESTVVIVARIGER